MVILGIDPGIAIVGYGIIKYEGNKFTVIDYGAVTTAPSMSLPERLKVIYRETEGLIDTYHPDVVTVEELFFNKNVKTALTVGHGRGVAILAAANKGLNIYEYTPLQVKQSVVGYGRAEKAQVQQMVKVILSLTAVPKPDDVADALAVAVCHAHSANMNNRLRHGYI
ncbi:MAG: crossover junction endodeoxyribonuclease RuvC [Clostridia bacterium]|jgi:crossover junction endodeoxyribonuclease RuvC|uniref:crossover junction endodeoxyribonuclease RuvC n=1 Tax=Petroclostridium xylanilyticum TaxID=1792311 RepID=UPI000B98925C|nr:crossover junction endodeoxyribonuclease RuvC [Petroclostridium xylanilyticum]MBZ4645529.1 crossover junction endodeoxyribonuclease RuvC [Clostridia bacterium]